MLEVGRLHWTIYLPAILIMVLALGIFATVIWVSNLQLAHLIQIVAAVVAAAGLTMAGAVAIRQTTTEIVVTDRRVIFKRGVVSRHTAEMNISKIETVDVEQGLLARMLNYGTVVIHGTGSGFEPLRRVGAPLRIRNAIVAG